MLKRRNIFQLLLMIIATQIHLSNSQVLEGLKDAVLNAEGLFTDIFKSLEAAAKHIKFSHEALKDAVEEECTFVCHDGSVPKKNKYHSPKSNGCGVPGMKIDTEFLPLRDMTKCCDQHDICYSTCNKDKDECDLSFKKCLYKLCGSTKSTETIISGCKSAAKMLYSGTLMFGCKFYKSSQQEACYCPPPRRFTGDEF